MKKTYSEIEQDVQYLIKSWLPELIDVDWVVGISRGGLFPAMVVSTSLIKPLVAAYIDKQDNVYFDQPNWISDKNVLLVDDIIRTGKTIEKIRSLLVEKGAKSIKILTPYKLQESNYLGSPTYSIVTNEDIEFPWDRG